MCSDTAEHQKEAKQGQLISKLAVVQEESSQPLQGRRPVLMPGLADHAG